MLTTEPGIERQVQAVRSASRRMVRELGMLGGHFSVSGLSSSQCHILIELDEHGELTAGKLSEILRLDKSTVSRLLQSLAMKGWLAIERDEEDGRRQIVRLTRSGRQEAERIHAISNELVLGAFGGLDQAARDRVIDGLETYAAALERAARRKGVVIRKIEPRDDRSLALLIRETMAEFGVSGPGTAHADPEVDRISESYLKERHAYFVVEQEGTVLGGGGIGPLSGADGSVCELRKMYLRPAMRGIGVGRQLLESCLSAARELGFRQCYLETVPQMLQAQALYRKLGFVQTCEPMGDTGHHKCDVWYVKDL
ncbi:MAG TPA: helix-turn-helix domain-containing GNAT family N-acetyltransferase [Fimbriimonadaceae bacterium]|nr:helix-turn-helix domain-containing GNAT family N-acetyltransferase [Fimbriimonadaceae bacterium]